MASKTLHSLVTSATQTLHDKRTSIQTFNDLDVAKVAASLELDRNAKRLGQDNLPASDAEAPDEIHSQIVERIRAEQKKAHQFVEDELNAYAERLTDLEFEQQISAIRQAVPACVGEFRGEVTRGLDELHGPRDNFQRAHEERASFERKNKLDRAARTPGGAAQFFKGALIVLILIVESVLNGVFLATGSVQGLLGGVSTAVGFAFLNIGIALLAGRFGAPELSHRNWFRKLLGLASLGLYGLLAVALNLGLAHYRDVAGDFSLNAGQLVMQRLQEAPLQLDDLMSWILFGIGLGFSIIAFIDAYLWNDPYPQYGAVQSRLDRRRQEYTRIKDNLIENLDNVRQEYVEQINEISQDLTKRRREFDMILNHRTRLISLFDQHQNQLETAANLLLSQYQQTNERVRSDPPPGWFHKTWSLPRIDVRPGNEREINSADLDRWVSEASGLLGDETRAIHTEYEKAFEQYRRLDDMIRKEEAG